MDFWFPQQSESGSHLGWGAEVVAANLEKMADSGQQLSVDGKAGIELVAALSHQAHCKFMLEHDDCCPEVVGQGEQLEGEGG